MLLEIAALVDARGLGTEASVARAKQVLLLLEPGAVVEILTTDPAAPDALVSWCGAAGHDLVEAVHEGEVHRFVVRHR